MLSRPGWPTPARLPPLTLARRSWRSIGTGSCEIGFLLFWTGGRDVGGARLTWHGHADTRTLALLIGTNHERAPRNVNE